MLYDGEKYRVVVGHRGATITRKSDKASVYLYGEYCLALMEMMEAMDVARTKELFDFLQRYAKDVDETLRQFDVDALLRRPQ